MPTDDQIADVASEYGLGDDAALTGVRARGEMGEVWQLRCTAGVVALKHVFEPVAEADVLEEVEFAGAARRAGALTPAVLLSHAGRVLFETGGQQFRVSEWIDMDELDIGIDPAKVGELVARLHCCGYTGRRPEDPWYTEPVGADRWRDVVSELRAARAPFADRLDAMVADLIELEQLIEPAANLQTCHRDLWADNVRSAPRGDLCVFDWDNCGLADPSHELAMVLFEFAGEDAERAQALSDAYVVAGGHGRAVRRGSFSMVIAQLHHIAEIGCRRWLEAAPDSPERPRQEARFEEFAGRRLTMPIVDGLLDAVRG